jgi:hypothetical protein
MLFFGACASTKTPDNQLAGYEEKNTSPAAIFHTKIATHPAQ